MRQSNIEEVLSIIKNNINDFVSKNNIKLVYIFGSYAKGKNNKNSDLDIAVLLEREYDPLVKLSLIGDLTLLFKRDDIDLVILNAANSVLKHQVIKYGKLAYMESEETKVYFEARTLSEYMDMEPFRRTQMKYINEKIKNSVGGE